MSAWRPPRASESSGASNRPSHANTRLQPATKLHSLLAAHPLVFGYSLCSLLAHRRRWDNEVLVLLLDKWSHQALEKQMCVVRDAIRRACVDADSTARTHGRRAYWAYKRAFPGDAEQLFARLDAAAQKQLERERNVGSVDSLQHIGTGSKKQAIKQASMQANMQVSMQASMQAIMQASMQTKDQASNALKTTIPNFIT
ncbi:hypothetical protein MSG28_015223 [Choristoneura fumiferana]|uniref:Uncharacterized protein n=1 Tax=Choristoneura fumiferana TaxID=7141 RepID=A0ACC0L001_CHOFU|nr:hypothetical protein MSG28_015223 [Choristoneura fumiferana]